MARILFISDNILNEGLGIMYLSSYLKANGHDVDLTLLQDYKRFDDLVDYVEEADPDLVGFSAMTPQVEQFRPVSRLIKEKTGRTIIWGGAHCMFMSEDIMNYGCVDIICMGDGEEALLDRCVDRGTNCASRSVDRSTGAGFLVECQPGFSGDLRAIALGLDGVRLQMAKCVAHVACLG